MGLTLRNPYVASPRSQEFDEGSFARLEDLLVEVVCGELKGRRGDSKGGEQDARHILVGPAARRQIDGRGAASPRTVTVAVSLGPSNPLGPDQVFLGCIASKRTLIG